MLYHFQLELSDMDRGVYQTLDFRTAQHPSESPLYLLSRVFAYALNFHEGLEFSPGGLNDPDAPALRAIGVHGAIDQWIEIGSPSVRKLHKASKAATQVMVYNYKNPELFLEEIKANDIHRAADIHIFAFDPNFLQSLTLQLQKNNRWSILHQEGHLDIGVGETLFSTDLKRLN